MTVRAKLRGALILAAAIAVSAGVLSPAAPLSPVAPATAAVSAPAAVAANGVDFNPSLIIADSLFYDNNAMSSPQIQQFLDAQIGSCTNGRCLNVAVLDFPNKPRVVSVDTGQTKCEAVAGGRISAAELIYRVQVSCGISAKVVLTMMQKEQSLVTSRAPGDWALMHAMGMGCPDTAPCNTAFEGLGNQIYSGTMQLNTYKASRFGKQPGWNYIQYSPNASCGGTSLNIANYATAALYNYTPYQPNRAALNNLYGTGDGCSAYGNRNFWRIYSDWFGSPNGIVADRIQAAYDYTGGAGGWLGPATSGFACGLRNGGCFKWFQNGIMYASLTTPAVALAAPEVGVWLARGGQDGVLGYPLTALGTGLQNGGSYQAFEGGSIYTSPSGTWPVFGAIRDTWTTTGNEWGPAGYPASAETCGLPSGGCFQQFQQGRIYWSPATGAQYTSAEMESVLAGAGGVGGWIGYPVTVFQSGLRDGGAYQIFQRATLYSSTAGTWPVFGAVRDAWAAVRNEWGPAGYPTAGQVGGLPGGGVYQTFEHGRIYWSPATGAQYTSAEMESVLAGAGGVGGWIGYPVTVFQSGLRDGGAYQIFQRATLYSSAAGTWPVFGAVRDAWAAVRNEWGPAGYPASGQIGGLVDGGVYQQFEHGRIYWSPATGAQFVPDDVFAVFSAAGGESGTYGYPVGAAQETPGAVTQVFQRGTITVAR